MALPDRRAINIWGKKYETETFRRADSTVAAGISACGNARVQVSAADAAYPVQLFRFGIGDTNRSVMASSAQSGAYLSSVKQGNGGTSAEKFSLNYISAGTYEIVSAETGYILTNNAGLPVMQPDSDAANQRWKITGAEKDREGYYLYYKVTASDGSVLTFNPDSNSLAAEKDTGDIYQKFKLNLDGLQGYAADCTVDGYEKAGTIGGLLGETVLVSTTDEMIKAMQRTEPLTIVMTKTLDFHPYGQQVIRSDKTLTAYYGATLKDCQLRTCPTDTNSSEAPSDNLVFRNLNLLAKDSTNCMLFNIYSSRQIWIDHCSFVSELGRTVDEVGKFIWCNSPFDGTWKSRATDFMTISYCSFYNRYWTTLFASVSYEVPDNEKIRCRVSFLYPFYDQCVRRCPQLGSAFGHIISGFWRGKENQNDSGTDEIIGGGQTDVVSQNCRFEAITSGHEICAGGGPEPYRDDNSYTAKNADSTPTKINFSPKVTSSRHPETENYGYALVDPIASKNTKDFCLNYSKAAGSADKLKYITDADMAEWISVSYPDPFLRDVFAKNEPVTGGEATFDTAHKYILTNANSDLPLAASGENAVQSASGADGWYFEDAESGWYYLRSEAGGYLAVAGESADNGANIGISETGTAFRFVGNADGSYTLVTAPTSGGSAVGITGGSAEDGANAMQWVRDSTDNQNWFVSVKVDPISGRLIKNLTVDDLDTYRNWSIDSSAAVGDLLYGDRDAVYTALPDALTGAEMIVPACDAKNSTGQLAHFAAGADMTVYIALDDRVTAAPAWLGDYEKTALTASNDKGVSFVLYLRDVKAGAEIALGENGQSAGCVQYTVFAVQTGSAKGDVNGDGTVSTADAVALQKYLLAAAKSLPDWTAGDLDGNGRLNAADLTLIKRILLG